MLLPFKTSSDILFVPSAYEGIASVVFEAMSSAMVVVSANVGGHAEILRDDYSVLAPLVSAFFLFFSFDLSSFFLSLLSVGL